MNSGDSLKAINTGTTPIGSRQAAANEQPRKYQHRQMYASANKDETWLDAQRLKKDEACVHAGHIIIEVGSCLASTVANEMAISFS